MYYTMRGYQKNLGKKFGRKKARGGGSKKSVHRDCGNVYRLGAGRHGRKNVGNSRAVDGSCPCHPYSKNKFYRRLCNIKFFEHMIKSSE